MIAIETINARLAALGLGYEIRRHIGASGYYIVALRDGKEIIINSAMGIDWVREWAAGRVRDFFRLHVLGGAPYYPATGAEPIFHR